MLSLILIGLLGILGIALVVWGLCWIERTSGGTGGGSVFFGCLLIFVALVGVCYLCSYANWVRLVPIGIAEEQARIEYLETRSSDGMEISFNPIESWRRKDVYEEIRARKQRIIELQGERARIQSSRWFPYFGEIQEIGVVETGMCEG